MYLYDENGEVKSIVNSFATYVNEITKSIIYDIKSTMLVVQPTIIQLQDIHSWAEKLV